MPQDNALLDLNGEPASAKGVERVLNKIGMTELLLIAGVALLIFGPSKLPELGKSIGKSIREFKGAMKETTDAVTKEINEVKAAAVEPPGGTPSKQ